MFSGEIISSLFKNPSHVLIVYGSISNNERNHALTAKDPIQLTVTWLNLTRPNQTVKNNLKAKKIELPQMDFVLEKQLTKFSCIYQPLSICKIFIKKS